MKTKEKKDLLKNIKTELTSYLIGLIDIDDREIAVIMRIIEREIEKKECIETKTK